MREFIYKSPTGIAEAVAGLRRDGARALAGGTDLIPQVREGRRFVTAIVDLKRIPELAAISSRPDGGIAIGAVVTATAVARHPGIAAKYPAIAESARLIGSVQVQNRASLGGNICNAAPSADAIPALICHQALAIIAGPQGTRDMPLEALFEGPGRTALQPGDLLTAIILPPVAPRSAGRYLRFTPRREMDIAIAGAGTWFRLGTDERIAEARVVLASVGPTPIRALAAEKALLSERPSPALFKEAGSLAAQDAQPISDTRGSADYRRTLVAVLTQRALANCWQSLGGAEQAA